MRKVKICLFGLLTAVSLMGVLVAAQKKSPRSVPNAYRENNCVVCHASLMEPDKPFVWINASDIFKNREAIVGAHSDIIHPETFHLIASIVDQLHATA